MVSLLIKLLKILLIFLSKLSTQRGAQTYDPKIKTHMLYQRSQPGASNTVFLEQGEGAPWVA